MDALFEYRDTELYCHHSLDPVPEPENFSIHVHEIPEIYCFLSGNGHFLVEGTEYPLCPGDLLLMRPSESHRLYISPDQPYERIAIHFSESLFDSMDPDHTLLRPFYRHQLGEENRFPAERYPNLSGLFHNLQPNRLGILARLMLLLTELQEPGSASAESGRSDSFSRALVDYVNNHLFEELSLGQVGDTFSRSPSQISRTFRQATGTSLWEYVTIKRLLAARAMLQRGEPAVRAMAACGFTDYSAFYRAYRRRFGHGPGADRGT